MLSNHVQYLHNDDERARPVEEEVTAKTEEETASSPGQKKRRTALNVVSRTGGTPTLDKPFQCPQCDKCFSEYVTLSGHIEHYHGFKRQCNIDGCDRVLGSIQAFAEHYARHANAAFELPTDFEVKKAL